MRGIIGSKPPGMNTFSAPARAALRLAKSCVVPAGMRRVYSRGASIHRSPARKLIVPSRT